MVYVIFLCIALPLGLMLPILERRSRRLVFFLLLGMTTALVAYEVDTILYSLCGLDTVRFTQTVPPIVEEILKALPVLVFALKDPYNIVRALRGEKIGTIVKEA